MSGHVHSDAFDEGVLADDPIHKLYYAQYGKKDGKPGGQTSKGNTTYFNPSIYRVILLDQRGTGKSQPAGEVRNNTTPDLVSDIEILRNHLQIPKWHLIFGGSWGSTLALLYAQAYPHAVGSLILRGIFTTRAFEIEFSRGPLGAGSFFPEEYEAFVSHLPEDERGDLVNGYYKLLMSENRDTRMQAARAWNAWEMSIGSLVADEDGHILERENLEKIKHIPVVIIQGRYDLVCPPHTAWELGKALPKAKVIFVPDAGHGAKEPGTRAELLQACDEYADYEFQ
ncbi:hypothetical protein N7448_004851 [Penicillium atrosanguineum]|uniref:prolyl aminopeptidase n=1 Tax=Penicillium atrosanguineum TaxID=1132637 RepID=A0A9W9H2B1_9EURO|nr:hypothetical protein N7526_007708 [Penicillium atrosanguineum]KAJ5136297.1 hypothetical protein N7448_004851 [Penicillium atrosanguineum]KAJ5303328.1 hypothetical protein N7476_010127 [Penicillium atrosanguineum]